MKTYLLIAGYNYYPSSDTGDWIACYNTEEEATEAMNTMKSSDDKYGPDWYEIIDLKKWMCDDD